MRIFLLCLLLASTSAQIRGSSLRQNLTRANEMISELNARLLRIEQENEKLKESMDQVKDDLQQCQDGVKKSSGGSYDDLPVTDNSFDKDFQILKEQMEDIQHQVSSMYRKIKTSTSSGDQEQIEDDEQDTDDDLGKCEDIINSYGLLKMHKGYFLFSDQMRNWSDSKKYCQAYNLDLAKIDDAATNTAIGNYISSKGQKNWEYYWLGGRKNSDNALFFWMTGGKRQQGLKYSNWKLNEPDQSGDCILTYADSQWVDGDCLSNYRTICQLHTPDCTEPEPKQEPNRKNP